MSTRSASTIAPFRTSGVNPSPGAVRPVGTPTRQAPIENTTTPRQRRQVASHDAQLIDPTIGGDDAVVVLHIGAGRVSVPSGTRVAPGAQGVLYVLAGAALHVLVESGGRVRELVIDDDLASQIKAEAFGR